MKKGLTNIVKKYKHLNILIGFYSLLNLKKLTPLKRNK